MHERGILSLFVSYFLNLGIVISFLKINMAHRFKIVITPMEISEISQMNDGAESVPKIIKAVKVDV